MVSWLTAELKHSTQHHHHQAVRTYGARRAEVRAAVSWFIEQQFCFPIGGLGGTRSTVDTARIHGATWVWVHKLFIVKLSSILDISQPSASVRGVKMNRWVLNTESSLLFFFFLFFFKKNPKKPQLAWLSCSGSDIEPVVPWLMTDHPRGPPQRLTDTHWQHRNSSHVGFVTSQFADSQSGNEFQATVRGPPGRTQCFPQPKKQNVFPLFLKWNK